MSCNNACGKNKLNSIKTKKDILTYQAIEPFQSDISKEHKTYKRSQELKKKNLDEVNNFNKEYLEYINTQEKLINNSITTKMANNVSEFNNDFFVLDNKNDLANNPVIKKYQNDFDVIFNDINENISSNKDLKQKMNELNHNDNSLSIENKNTQDVIMYSNLILTAIATTSLFYLFTQD
tara:strand:- start:2820 stop:3356 length:537 start_codon:yes stop_codon:yes gene_type:complete